MTTETSPLTVIVPNFNDGALLPNLVKSLLRQGLKGIEILIFDDGSTDDSVNIIKSIIDTYSDERIRLIEHGQNRGIIYTMNLGVELASSKYIYFAAADDLILDGFLKSSIDALRRWPDAGIAFSRVIIEQNGLRCLPKFRYKQFEAGYIDPSKCRRILESSETWMGGNGCVYDKGAYQAVGGAKAELGGYVDLYLSTMIAIDRGVCFTGATGAIFVASTESYSGRQLANATSGEMLAKRYSQAPRMARSMFPKLVSEKFAQNWEARIHIYQILTGYWRQFTFAAANSKQGGMQVEGIKSRLAMNSRARALLKFSAALAKFLMLHPILTWNILKAQIAMKKSFYSQNKNVA